MAFHPEDRVVASCSEDKSIKLWNLDDGGLLSTMRGHSEPINSVAFSPDGLTIASGSGDDFGGDDNSVRVWDVKTGKQLWQLTGHTDKVTGVCFDPTGKTIVSCSLDKTIRFWDSATGAAIGSPVTGHIR